MSPITTEYPFLRKDRPHLTDIEIKRAENYYFLKATKEVKKFSSEKEYKDSYIVKNGILYFVGRILDSQEINFSEDGLSCTATLEYRNPGEKTFRKTRRSVRTVVVVHRESELDLYQVIEQAAQEAAQGPDSDP